MPQVKMPDGTIVDMPDQLDPQLGARLRALNDSQMHKFGTGRSLDVGANGELTPTLTHPNYRPATGTDPGRQPQEGDLAPAEGAPEGFYSVTDDSGNSTLRHNTSAFDVANSLPGLGVGAHMVADVANTGSKALAGLTGLFGASADQVAARRDKMHIDLPESHDPALQAMGTVMNTGAKLLEPVTKPIDDAVGNASPGVRTAVEGAEEAVPDILTVLGVKAGLPSRAAAEPIIASGDVDAALKQAGYKSLARQDPNGGTAAKVGTSVTGEPAVASQQSLNNQAVTTTLARHEAGAAGDGQLTYEGLAKARANGPGKVYNAAYNALPNNMAQDPQLATALRSMGDTTSQLPRSPDIDALKEAMLAQPQMTRDQLFANISQARDRASRFHASDQPDAHAIGDAYNAVANAYEDYVGRQLGANPQSPVSLSDWQSARVKFAKNYAVQSALKGTDVDAAKIAALQRKNPDQLTGGLRLIAEQHNRYPLSTRFGPNTFAADGTGSSGSIEGGIARHITGPAIGAGIGSHMGGTSGAALGAAAGYLGSAGFQGFLRRLLGGNPELGAARGAEAPTDPRLSYFFGEEGGGAPPSPGGPPGMPSVDFTPPGTPPLGFAPEGGAPPRSAPSSGELSLADLLSTGVEQPPARGLSLGDEFTQPSGLTFRGSPDAVGAKAKHGGQPQRRTLTDDFGEQHFTDDLDKSRPDIPLGDRFANPEDNWFTEGKPNKDLAGVMSQGVPEDIVSRSSPRRSAMASDTKKGQLANNASGESSASIEAINRNKMEREAGQERYLIDEDGKMWPVRGVDSVDAKAPKGSIIVQKGVGKDPYTILDRGGLPHAHAKGLLNRALAGGTGVTLGDLLGAGAGG